MPVGCCRWPATTSSSGSSTPGVSFTQMTQAKAEEIVEGPAGGRTAPDRGGAGHRAGADRPAVGRTPRTCAPRPARGQPSSSSRWVSTWPTSRPGSRSWPPASASGRPVAARRPAPRPATPVAGQEGARPRSRPPRRPRPRRRRRRRRRQEDGGEEGHGQEGAGQEGGRQEDDGQEDDGQEDDGQEGRQPLTGRRPVDRPWLRGDRPPPPRRRARPAGPGAEPHRRAGGHRRHRVTVGGRSRASRPASSRPATRSSSSARRPASSAAAARSSTPRSSASASTSPACRALDAGASTGGFTDCLLQRGAAQVVAVDVGHGQLHQRAAGRPAGRRPRALQRPRTSTPEAIGGPVDLVVADLSFISLRPCCRRCWPCAAPGAPTRAPGEAAVRGRPGRGLPGHGAWSATPTVRRARPGPRSMTPCARRGATIMGWMDSPLRGADGNVEFFVHAPAPRGSTRRSPSRARRSRDQRAVIVAHHERAEAAALARAARPRGWPTTAHGLDAAGADAAAARPRRPGRRRARRARPTWPSASAATARCCARSSCSAARRADPRRQRRPARLPHRGRARRPAQPRSSAASPATTRSRSAWCSSVDRRSGR